MDSINRTNKLTINPDVVYTDIDGDIVMMGPNDGMYYSINNVGAEIWNLLQTQPMSLADLCSQMGRNYQVDQERCQSDTVAFIDDLIKQNMILAMD